MLFINRKLGSYLEVVFTAFKKAAFKNYFKSNFLY